MVMEKRKRMRKNSDNDEREGSLMKYRENHEEEKHIQNKVQ